MNNINSYIEENKDRFLNELINLLKIPSISADPAYKDNDAVIGVMVGLEFEPIVKKIVNKMILKRLIFKPFFL